MAWFQEQADHGLLGHIDYELTGDGVIAGRDGFRGLTFSERELTALGRASGGASCQIEEADESSLFLIIRKYKFPSHCRRNNGGR